jgi:GMP synthase-like glutamine amidotransferase
MSSRAQRVHRSIRQDIVTRCPPRDQNSRGKLFSRLPGSTVVCDDIGSIALWLAAHDAQITYTRFYQKPLLPDPKTHDLIIAMGGPMSVNDELELPWLRDEKRFIRSAIENGKPVLGICLGAQLIASALGSRVYRNPLKEIGWFPIEATPGATEGFRFPPTCDVFHWHGETFDLPVTSPSSIRLDSAP